MSPSLRGAFFERGLGRRLVLVVTGVLAVLIAWEVANLWPTYVNSGELGQDWRFYVGIGRQWLDTGVLYTDRQLSGLPYHVIVNVDNLYPPPAILLFAPFALLPEVVSAILWWGIPIAVVTFAVARLRPAAWTWPLIALAVFWPRTIGSLLVGNSDLLSAAFVAGGILWGWPGALGLYKLSLAPFALAGARRRSWWICLAVIAAVSGAFLVSGAWADYLVAVTHWDLPWDRQLLNVPILLIPVLAWLGRRDRSVSSTLTGKEAP
jgi:hypothetical protein